MEADGSIFFNRFGYLALGGQTGMLMIKDLDTNWTKIWSVGRGINNSVCLSKKNKKTFMTVCNNDQTVSIFLIPEMEKVQTLKMPSAINYSKFRWCLLSNDHQINYGKWQVLLVQMVKSYFWRVIKALYICIQSIKMDAIQVISSIKVKMLLLSTPL